MRPLTPQEIGQIAGRAGRHIEDGTFGVTGEARPFDPELVEAIESHRFAPVKKLMWRNATLDFGSADRLIRSLEAPTSDDWLTRARDADDVLALKALTAMPEVHGPPDRCQTRGAFVGCLPDSRFPQHLGRRSRHPSGPHLRLSLRARPRRRPHPDRLAGQGHRPHRPDRRATSTPCRADWRISAPGPTLPSARIGSMTNPIGGTRRAL